MMEHRGGVGGQGGGSGLDQNIIFMYEILK